MIKKIETKEMKKEKNEIDFLNEKNLEEALIAE